MNPNKTAPRNSASASPPDHAQLRERLKLNAVGLADVLYGSPLHEVCAVVVPGSHAAQRLIAELVQATRQ